MVKQSCFINVVFSYQLDSQKRMKRFLDWNWLFPEWEKEAGNWAMGKTGQYQRPVYSFADFWPNLNG